MACLSHNREHKQDDPSFPICEGDHPDRVLTCHEARMLLREAKVQCRLPAVPSVYGVVAGTAEDRGKGRNGNDMCRWMGTQSVSHPRSICHRLSRAVSCHLLSGKLVPAMLGAAQ